MNEFLTKSTWYDHLVNHWLYKRMEQEVLSGRGPFALKAAMRLAFNAPRAEEPPLAILEELECFQKTTAIPGLISHYNAKCPKENWVYELDPTEQKPGYFTKRYTEHLEAFADLCAAIPYVAFDVDSCRDISQSESNRIHLSEIIRVS